MPGASSWTFCTNWKDIRLRLKFLVKAWKANRLCCWWGNSYLFWITWVKQFHILTAYYSALAKVPFDFLNTGNADKTRQMVAYQLGTFAVMMAFKIPDALQQSGMHCHPFYCNPQMLNFYWSRFGAKRLQCHIGTQSYQNSIVNNYYNLLFPLYFDLIAFQILFHFGVSLALVVMLNW